MRTFAAFAALAIALGPAGARAAAPQATDLGGTRGYVVADDTALLEGIQLVVAAGLDRETLAQSGIAALAAESVLRTPVDGTPLREAIVAHGGSFTYALGPQYVRFYLEAPPESISACAALVARALAADPTPAGIGAAQKSLGARISDDEKNPVLVGIEMVRQSYYRGGAGLPALGTTASIANLSVDDVRAFRAAHYRRASATITLIGRADDAGRAAARALAGALRDGSDPAPKLAINAPTSEARRIVTHRDVAAPYVVIGFAAPSPGEADFAPMLVARALLADVFDRSSATTLPAFRLPVGTVYGYDARPATFDVYVNGAQVDPAAGLTTIDAVLRGAAEKPLGNDLLSRYKAIARGRWATDVQTLSDRAWEIGNLVAQGLDPAIVDRVPSAIDRVTARDLQRIVAKYLRKYTVALVLPREGGAGS